MPNNYPSLIQKLIDYFSQLPGIGPKTAEKFVFYLLKQPQEYLENFSSSLLQLKAKVTVCPSCFNYSEKQPCSICRDPKRNKNIICVVAKPQDVAVIEKTGDYQGVYHVLGGLLNPLEDVTPDKIKIKELLNRIKKDGISEIILALNTDIEGETTTLYLKKTLLPSKTKLTRLARGLPIGSDLQYADEVTLSNALKGRKEI